MEEQSETEGGADSKDNRRGVRYISEELLLKLTGCQSLALVNSLNLSSLTGGKHIKFIEHLHGCQRLQVLNLNHNVIQRMERLNALTQLRVLQLAHNNIKRIEGLELMSSLQHLNLSYNRIEHVPLWLGKKLHSLHTLHLQHNLITSLYEVSRLRSLSSLSELSVSDNPASSLPHARLFLLYHLRTLERLNDLPISQEERGHAHQRFNSEEQNRLQQEVDGSQSELGRLQKQQQDAATQLHQQEEANRNLTAQIEAQHHTHTLLLQELHTKSQLLENTTAELTRVLNRLYELEQEWTLYKIDTKCSSLPPCSVQEVDSVTESQKSKAQHIRNTITSTPSSSSSSLQTQDGSDVQSDVEPPRPLVEDCRTEQLKGCLFTFGHCVFPPGSCDNYTNITEPWRNYLFTSSSFPGFPKNDAHLAGKWLRFTGIGGERLLYTCTAGPGAGSKYMINVPYSYPTLESSSPLISNAFAYVTKCHSHYTSLEIVLCPGKYYIYRQNVHPHSNATYATYHYKCETDSCGPLAECSGTGGCECVSGYEIPPEHLPTQYSYGCADIDECERPEEVCDPLSNCTNTIGSYLCVCWDGYQATNPALPTGLSNKCTDIDECLDEHICGDHGDCANNPGSYMCECHKGYDNEPDPTAVCQDIDECLNSTICGPYTLCTNIPGAFTCACQRGFKPTAPDEEPGVTNICIDIDECVENATICGPSANCTNEIGSHNCTCAPGYRGRDADRIASVANPCTDIDECSETPGICGRLTVCTNVEGTFYCSCPDGLYPSTGILWTVGVSFCQSLQDILDEINPPEGQTKERAFLGHMDTQLKDKDSILPVPTVTNCFSAVMQVSGVGPRVKSTNVSSEGDGETGSFILSISDRLVSAVVEQGQNQTERTVTTPTVDLSVRTIVPGSQNSETSALSANGNTMEINLEDMAENNNGSAAAAFMILHGMESLLSHQYFETENLTEMNSDVITAVLPFMNNTNLTEPVNFTIHHKKTVPENGLVTCVYWEDKTEEKEEGREEKKMMRWSVEGCWVAYTSENYTVCSCSHLSTFALIMQIGEPPPEDPFLEWLNRICVIVGLFFFGLAIFTFLLCSWNPKINNTARLHLCINLALSHLLLLWNDRYTDHELACTVMAGLLHFLVVASFVWMLLEALQLHLLVRRLSKVQVIQRDGLPRPLLYMIGYGVPFVIVGTSALIYSDGYGATEAEVCWLSRKRSFNWALTGPVIAIIGLNWILFCATLWSLKPTLVNMKSGVSQSKDIRLVVFKILAQFVILGCTWILGLYQTNLFFQVLFIFLNSQQGTFLFIIHCVLNKEVREEYIKILTCSFNKHREGGSKRVASISEDLDKAEEKKK